MIIMALGFCSLMIIKWFNDHLSHKMILLFNDYYGFMILWFYGLIQSDADIYVKLSRKFLLIALLKSLLCSLRAIYTCLENRKKFLFSQGFSQIFITFFN